MGRVSRGELGTSRELGSRGTACQANGQGCRSGGEDETSTEQWKLNGMSSEMFLGSEPPNHRLKPHHLGNDGKKHVKQTSPAQTPRLRRVTAERMRRGTAGIVLALQLYSIQVQLQRSFFSGDEVRPWLRVLV